MHSPDLARRWSRLGEYLRFSTSLPKKLNELAIIVTGRRWNSQLEFLIHAQAAKAAELDPACIEAIRRAEPPTFADEAEAEVYEFTRLLQQTGTVEAPLHASVMKRWGARGVVELTGVIGYYTMVSMMLNAQEIPIPNDAEPPLSAITAGLNDAATVPNVQDESNCRMTAMFAPRMPSAPHCTPDCACDWSCHVFGPYDKFSAHS